MAEYRIAELPLGEGHLGIGPMPGRGGSYQHDVTAILTWGADLVLTMAEVEELAYSGASSLGDDLAAAGVSWRHLPVLDLGAPNARIETLWPDASTEAHRLLQGGGRVFAHCYGGCGRAGMALLRLMVEAGETADHALERLRGVRPCAVETEGQKAWAARPMYDRLGWTP